MKREIKFRGKRAENGEWVYGYLLIAPSGTCYIVTMVDAGIAWETQRVEVYPNTVGQYTGMKDKNGNEVYEGDILRIEDQLRFKCGRWANCTDISEVIWNELDGGWSQSIWKAICKDKEELMNGYISMATNIEDTEVIGNIHDNPELIGGTKS